MFVVGDVSELWPFLVALVVSLLRLQTQALMDSGYLIIPMAVHAMLALVPAGAGYRVHSIYRIINRVPGT